jgi:hypothetical protein
MGVHNIIFSRLDFLLQQANRRYLVFNYQMSACFEFEIRIRFPLKMT